MKKYLTLVLVAMVLSLVFTACKSSKGAHCDAYGSIDQEAKADLTSK